MNAPTLRHRIIECVLDGDSKTAENLAKESVTANVNPLETLDFYIEGIREVGSLWEAGEYFLPELVSGAEAVVAALKILRPAMTPEQSRSSGHVAVIGSVAGDVHDIGKSLVGSMLLARGFDVVDLGTDVATDDFVDAVEQRNASLLGLSALLTTTMLSQKIIIEKLKERGLRDGVKVLIGGAPVTSSWADEIGADGTAADAVSAAVLACELVGIA
jgi:corrinoid protein of di/trimethylamine methyltransferase